MIVGGVRQVHADVMSESALALLQDHSVLAGYGQLVHHIINRAGTDWCPAREPFGYAGLCTLLDDMERALEAAPGRAGREARQ